MLLLFTDTWYLKSLAFVVFSAASLTDFYDGKLARAGNQVTPLGRFLDPLADKILVTSALIALALDKMVNFWLVLPIVGRDILITGMRLYGCTGAAPWSLRAWPSGRPQSSFSRLSSYFSSLASRRRWGVLPQVISSFSTTS